MCAELVYVLLSLTSAYVDGVFQYFLLFFFEQKTAYEMLRSLVGSEMCIRDSDNLSHGGLYPLVAAQVEHVDVVIRPVGLGLYVHPVSYTHLTLPTIYTV